MHVVHSYEIHAGFSYLSCTQSLIVCTQEDISSLHRAAQVLTGCVGSTGKVLRSRYVMSIRVGSTMVADYDDVA